MNKKIIVIIGSTVLLIALFALFNFQSNSSTESPDATLTAQELYELAKSGSLNEEEIVQVSGTITNIKLKKVPPPVAYVHLSQVSCRFGGRIVIDQVAELQEGDYVLISCMYNNFVSSEVLLDNCSIINS